ncbi:MAG: methyltransferase domain-containing protein [Candidatus Dormibacteria bacterium]
MWAPRAVVVTEPADSERGAVRSRYASIALGVGADRGAVAACCGPDCGGSTGPGDQLFGSVLYEAGDRSDLPEHAVLASLGCGNPLAVADLHQGETVLDLGSGGGIDVLLSARRVGPTGRVIGLDMTDEMLALARRNALAAGATNVEFLRGAIEAIPLRSAEVDVIISNCVVNLSPDKPAVIGEMFRVLRPGGRLGISDVVAEDHLTPTDRRERGTLVGCVAGALSVSEYRVGLEEAGFTDVDVRFSHQVADGMHAAIVQARKPAVS